MKWAVLFYSILHVICCFTPKRFPLHALLPSFPVAFISSFMLLHSSAKQFTYSKHDLYRYVYLSGNRHLLRSQARTALVTIANIALMANFALTVLLQYLVSRQYRDQFRRLCSLLFSCNGRLAKKKQSPSLSAQVPDISPVNNCFSSRLSGKVYHFVEDCKGNRRRAHI